MNCFTFIIIQCRERISYSSFSLCRGAFFNFATEQAPFNRHAWKRVSVALRTPRDRSRLTENCHFNGQGVWRHLTGAQCTSLPLAPPVSFIYVLRLNRTRAYSGRETQSERGRRSLEGATRHALFAPPSGCPSTGTIWPRLRSDLIRRLFVSSVCQRQDRSDAQPAVRDGHIVFLNVGSRCLLHAGS